MSMGSYLKVYFNDTWFVIPSTRGVSWMTETTDGPGTMPFEIKTNPFSSPNMVLECNVIH